MQLVINTYGSYLHVVQDSFELKIEHQKKRISPKKINSILLTTGISLSSDAIQLALENNIEIQFLDKYGDSIGKIWHSRLGRTSYIRRKQLDLVNNEVGVLIIKDLLLKKANNMVSHLEEISLRRNEDKKKFISMKIVSIKEIIKKIENLNAKEIDFIRYNLMGYEGNVAKLYFKCLSYVLPKRYQFKGRSNRPGKDEFNCILNYGYGVLYSKVEKALLIAGLDPYTGILHTDGYNKKSFVYDFIEPYRYHVDKVVMKLFAKKEINKNHFDNVKGGLTLNENGKKVLILELNEYFENRIRYDGRDIKINDVIQYDAHKLANYILEVDSDVDMDSL